MSTNKNEKNEKNDKEDRTPIESLIVGRNENQDAVPEHFETNRDAERTLSAQQYQEEVASAYLQRRGRGLILSPTDEGEIDTYLSDHIPLGFVLKGIHQAFDKFKPKHDRDEIKSLRYCTPIIRSLHAQQGSVPAAGSSGAVLEVDAALPEESYEVHDLLEQLKLTRGDKLEKLGGSPLRN